MSRYDEGQNPTAAERVRESIRLYHLDHPRLVSERRKIWKRIEVLIKRGETYLTEGRPLDEVKADLHELIKPTTPLSRIAKVAIRGRRELQWIRDWLEEIETTL